MTNKRLFCIMTLQTNVRNIYSNKVEIRGYTDQIKGEPDHEKTYTQTHIVKKAQGGIY